MNKTNKPLDRPTHVQKLIDGHRAQMAHLASRTESELTGRLRCSREELRDSIADFRSQRAAQLRNLRKTANYNCLVQGGWSAETVISLVGEHGAVARRHQQAGGTRVAREEREREAAWLTSRRPRRFRELDDKINNREPGEVLREKQRRDYERVLMSDDGRHLMAAASLNRVLGSQGAAQIDFARPMRPV
jgi:hypothetical protein